VLSSTFNFELEGADVGPDTELSVALLETTCTAESGNSEARFPASGTQLLEAQAVGKLRVVLVPVQNGGQVPDTGAAQVERLRETMLALYPVADVELTVDEVLSWPYPVSANSGWVDLLDEIKNERSRDQPERDVYYYGLVTPERDFNSYCGFGCVLGIAPAPLSVSPAHQVGVGLGYLNEVTYETMAHELGHAHGRLHAPTPPTCGAQPADTDREFPSPDGHIDAWGWDSRSSVLVEPSAYDLMGYCDPVWTSAYTYNGLASRSMLVNTSFKVAGVQEALEWTGIVLYADGTARWTGRITGEVGGHPETARARDASGASVGEVTVARVELSHSDDTLLYVSDLPATWFTLELSDRTIVRDSLLPALEP
jgi:hypothetical protein